MALQTGWIACTERFPETTEDCFLFEESVDILFTDGREIWYGVYRYTPADEEWDTEERREWTWGDGWYAEDIIAWRHLPSLECFSGPNSPLKSAAV